MTPNMDGEEDAEGGGKEDLALSRTHLPTCSIEFEYAHLYITTRCSISMQCRKYGDAESVRGRRPRTPVMKSWKILDKQCALSPRALRLSGALGPRPGPDRSPSGCF